MTVITHHLIIALVGAAQVFTLVFTGPYTDIDGIERGNRFDAVVTFHLVAHQKVNVRRSVRRLMQNSLVTAFAFQTMNVTTVQIAVTAN
jgi:hypothetical protein